jgi:signal transduction histidine kinase
METENRNTWFAPAERADMDVVLKQYGYFRDDPLLVKTLEAISTVILILNQHRQIVFANKAFQEMAKYNDLPSLLGHRVGEAVDCIHWNDRDGGCGTSESCQECGAVRAILSGLDGKQDVQDCRITLNDRNQALDLRVMATPLEYLNESFIVFSVLDVASEKRSQVLERLFLHDVRNTVGSLQGYSRLLSEENDTELDLIKKMILDLSGTLIDEIESYSQLKQAETSILEVNHEAFSTLELLERIMARYTKHQVAFGKNIRVDANAENIMMISDETLLARVIGNMAKNALESTQAGHTVTLSCVKQGRIIRFSVHNPGLIPRKVQLQIFQRSFSTKGTGRGLGTYSIKLLSEQYLLGKVGFITSEREGTTFYGEYPIEANQLSPS